LWNSHWYTLEWDNEQFPYFHEVLPDIDDFNKKSNRRAPNDYKDVPSFTAAQTAEESEKEVKKPGLEEEESKEADQQIQNSPIEVAVLPEQIPPIQLMQSETICHRAACRGGKRITDDMWGVHLTPRTGRTV
jgi:hypothetical protein